MRLASLPYVLASALLCLLGGAVISAILLLVLPMSPTRFVIISAVIGLLSGLALAAAQKRAPATQKRK